MLSALSCIGIWKIKLSYVFQLFIDQLTYNLNSNGKILVFVLKSFLIFCLYINTMTSRSQFILKISFLIIPFAILSLILHDGGTSGGVGGGGYDLSGLVYGSALFAVIILWMIWMIIAFLISKTQTSKTLHLRLIIIGVIALISAWFITPTML